METSEQTITLANLAAAEEQFQEALERVLENIDDPNFGDKARKIEVIITLKPDRETRLHALTVSCKTTLDKRREWQGKFVMGKEHGRMIGRMVELAEQPELPFNVVDLPRK